MNKRGIFVPVMVVVALIVLTYASFIFLTGEKVAVTKTIGGIQTDLMSSYSEGEKLLFYLDQSAKYAVYEANKELGEKGGSKENEYFLWTKESVPNYRENFIFYFKEKFKKYLERDSRFLKIEDYNLEIENNYIIGRTARDIFVSGIRVIPEEKIFTKPTKYEEYILEASKNYGVDVNLIKAVIKQESDFNEKAISKCGAVGLMQLMPGTAKDMGLKVPKYEKIEINGCSEAFSCNSKNKENCKEDDERFNARENIIAGVRYLKYLLDEFGDKKLAIAAYNAGPGSVKKYNDIPPYKETQDYVKRVLSNLDYFSSITSAAVKEKKELSLIYTVKPDFKQKTYLEDYEKIIENLKNKELWNCLSLPGEFKCGDYLDKSFKWSFVKENNIVKFDVETDHFKKITIKFAIDLNKPLF